ncbi:MAG: RNB domain-containing ribonuclease [Polyangiaceae bacterium]
MTGQAPEAPPRPAEIEAIVRAVGLRQDFDADVLRETEEHLRDPAIDDGQLDDLEAYPFVTIDGPTSRDLDQALHVERSARGGFVVRYALADAAHFVAPGSALFREALLRGTSFYFPGFSVPMLPRALSENIVSLNPGVARRALLFTVELDQRAEILETKISRARIRSRAKLAFDHVQALYDAPAKSPLATEPFAESLRLLRAVGEARMALGDLKDVVRYRRREVEVKVDGASGEVVALEAVREEVELYNEQISLLVNREGGRILAESKDPRLQPIYRVHPAPDPERLEALRALTQGLAKLRELDPRVFALGDGEALSTLVARLPRSGPHAAVARAIERQAVLVNMRSAFSTQPARHFGVGAEVYARFSAPMREVVGIFLHKEMLEHLGLATPRAAAFDEALREEVVLAANRAREVQRQIRDRTNRIVVDRLFQPVRGTSQTFDGVVMGHTASKVHVELASPALDVKLYVRDLGRDLGGAWLEIADGGASLRKRDDGALVCAVGDAVRVTVRGFDKGQDRWVLGLV